MPVEIIQSIIVCIPFALSMAFWPIAVFVVNPHMDKQVKHTKFHIIKNYMCMLPGPKCASIAMGYCVYILFNKVPKWNKSGYALFKGIEFRKMARPIDIFISAVLVGGYFSSVFLGIIFLTYSHFFAG